MTDITSVMGGAVRLVSTLLEPAAITEVIDLGRGYELEDGYEDAGFALSARELVVPSTGGSVVELAAKELHWPPGKSNLVVIAMRRDQLVGRVFCGATMVEPSLEDKVMAMHLGSLLVRFSYVEARELS